MAKRRNVRAEDAGDIRTRHTRRQKRKRRSRRIRRIIFLFLLLVILIGILVFATPIFNIQAITISGNEKVPIENLQQMTNLLYGQNLFKVRSSQIKSAFASEPYIKSVNVRRILYVPQLKITVTESVPVACMQTENGYSLFDEGGKVLEIVHEKPGNIPEVKGINGNAYQPGQKFTADDGDKVGATLSLLNALASAELLSQVNDISVQEMTAVSFSYDGRLDVICGTTNDLPRKVSLLKEVLVSNRLPTNSRGTIDLSTAGKAIYTP